MSKQKNNLDIIPLSGIRKFLFHNPIRKFIFIIVIYLVLESLTEKTATNSFIRTIVIFSHIILAIYFVVVIVHIVRTSFNRLMKPTSFTSLIWAYCLFIFSIILIFSTILNAIELTGLGYIKYGVCSDKFDPLMVQQDMQVSHNFFYFTATTFLTVGYGDICPMGLAKIFAVITAFVGHLVSVILVALIINNYLILREKKQ